MFGEQDRSAQVYITCNLYSFPNGIHFRVQISPEMCHGRIMQLSYTEDNSESVLKSGEAVT
jgi:hypothetical protein